MLEGKRYVHAHCYRADEILMLMRVADDYGFKIRTFQHVLEGYKVAKEIAAHGAGASTFSDWWAYKMEAFDAIPYNAALMTKKGVVVSLNSDDAELMRHLNTEAGKAMKYGGLSETEALAMVTLNPAKQLGIDNRVGSIEVGKDADLVIYDKYPLSDYAKVQKVLIDGTEYFDRDKEVSGRGAKEGREAEADREGKAESAARSPGRARHQEGRTMRFLGILFVCTIALCRRNHTHPQRRRLSGDRRGDEGRLGADPGRQDRRHRREDRARRRARASSKAKACASIPA